MEKKKKNKYNKALRIVLILLCVVFFCIFSFSGYKLFSTLHEYKVAEKTYNKISSNFVSPKKDDPKPEDHKNEITESSPIEVDFPALREQGPDVVGWIYSEDTVINYPVVQAEDNFYYLHRFIDGVYNASGSLFLDCTCNGDFTGRNTVLYGHNMNDGSMFHSLLEYKNQDYYNEHPVMYLNTPTQNYKIEIFSAYVTDHESETYKMFFDSDEDFSRHLDDWRVQSLVSTNVALSTEDRVITLSTCTYDYYNARFVVQGKLTPVN